MSRSLPVLGLVFAMAASQAFAADVVLDPLTDPMPDTRVFDIRGRTLAETQLWAGIGDPRLPIRSSQTDEAFSLASVIGGGRTVSLTASTAALPPSFDDVIIDSGLLTYTGRNSDNSATLLMRYGDTPQVMQMNPLGLDVTDGGSNGRLALDVPTYSSDSGSDPMQIVVTLIGPDVNSGAIVSSVAARDISGPGSASIPLTEFSDLTGGGGMIDLTNVTSVMVQMVGEGVGNLNFEFAPIVFTSGTQSAGTPSSVGFDDSLVRILWFGNSHSGWNDFPQQTLCGGEDGKGVPDLFEFIAVEAGQPRPVISSAISCGRDLNFHWDNQRGRIFGDLQPGQNWSHVVIQGFSTETTVALGDVPNFQMRAQQLYGLTRQSSPGAQSIFYQTHARAPGHPNYKTSFAVPAEYHAQVRSTYRSTSEIINTNFGEGSSSNSPSGDGFARANWGFDMYRSDLNHMTPLGATVVALTFYGTIYNDLSLSNLGDSAFPAAGDLATRLTNLGMGEADWAIAKERARVALLSSACAADFNGDTLINANDATDMIAAVGSQEAFTDLVFPFGMIDMFDVLEWQSEFSVPCE